MATGKHDTEFYDGYEGEPEYILEREDGASLHIWEGYLSDIMDPPCAAPWKGFTRDYEECVRTYDTTEPVAIDVQEYLDDLRGYAGRTFEFADSNAVRERICALRIACFHASSPISSIKSWKLLVFLKSTSSPSAWKCAWPHLIFALSVGRSAFSAVLPFVSTTRYKRFSP